MALVPRLCGPTRHNSAQKKKSGRSGPFGFAEGTWDDGIGKRKPKSTARNGCATRKEGGGYEEMGGRGLVDRGMGE